MPIKLAPVAQVKQDVSVEIPQGNGKYKTKTLAVTYRLLSETELQEFQANEWLDMDVMLRDIVDIDRAAVPKIVPLAEGATLDDATLDDIVVALMDVRYIKPALLQGWRDTQANRGAYAEKN